MKRTSIVACLASLGLIVMASTAQAQCYAGPPVVAYSYAPPATTVTPFVGSSYAFYSPVQTPVETSAYYPAYSVYSPGFTAPSRYQPRYPNPGPYYYTPTYSYTPGYYSYYYTPGFFRY